MILQSSLSESGASAAADNRPPLSSLQHPKETPIEPSNKLSSQGSNQDSRANHDASQEPRQQDQEIESVSKNGMNHSHRGKSKLQKDNDEEEDEDDIYDEVEIISPNQNLPKDPIESAEPIQEQVKRGKQEDKKIWIESQANIQEKIAPSLPQPNAVMQRVKREEEEANYQNRMTNAYKSRLLLDQREPIKPEVQEAKIRQLNDPSMNQVTPLPLVQKGVYSLVSDMKLGWKPKNDKKATYLYEVPPVIAFRYKEDELYRQLQNMQQQQMAQPIQQQQNYARPAVPAHFPPMQQSNAPIQDASPPLTATSYTKETVVYRGFRPRDSLEMHENFRKQNFYAFEYPKYTNIAPQSNYEQLQQIADTQKQSSPVWFDSYFECGNLDRAVRISENQYELYLRSDTNTNGYGNWFYFKVSLNPEHVNIVNDQIAKGQTPQLSFKFNIVNMYKKYQLYCVGQKPIVFSVLKNGTNSGKPQWSKEGISGVRYSASKISQQRPDGSISKKLYQLSFTYQYSSTSDNDVYFAYSIPYSYSYLMQSIDELKKMQLEVYGSNNPVLDCQTLCKSLSGLTVPILTITDFKDTSVSLDQKKIILLQGRVHPGETHSSWIIHGFMKALLSKDSYARALRQKFIFKVIPMINPDGVVFGNYRTSFLGKDMNRMFISDFENREQCGEDDEYDDQDDSEKIDERLIPEIVAVRRLIQCCQSMGQQRIIGFFDFHQHSKRKSIFMYGPQYPLHHSQYQWVRVLPKIIGNTSDMFRVHSCRFRNEDYKENCARMFIEREYGVIFSYCIECSQQAYIDKNRNIIDFNESNLLLFGKHLAQSLLTFGTLIENQAKEIERKRQQRLLMRQQQQSQLAQVQAQNLINGSQASPIRKQQTQVPSSNGGHQRSMSAADNINPQHQKGKISPGKLDSNKPSEEEEAGDGAFFSLVRGNNLTLNDYIQMMNSGYREEEEEAVINDVEMNDYKYYQIYNGGRDDSLASSNDSEDQGMRKEDQENLFQDILINVNQQENRIGKILKKTLKIEIKSELLNQGANKRNNYLFLEDDDADLFEDEDSDHSIKRSKQKLTPSTQKIGNMTQIIQKPKKLQKQVQYSFNQFVPLEFPRERELKEMTSGKQVENSPNGKKRRQIASRSNTQNQVRKSPNPGTLAMNLEMRRLLEQQSIRRKFFMFDKGKREMAINFYQSKQNKNEASQTQLSETTCFIPSINRVETAAKKTPVKQKNDNIDGPPNNRPHTSLVPPNLVFQNGNSPNVRQPTLNSHLSQNQSNSMYRQNSVGSNIHSQNQVDPSQIYRQNSSNYQLDDSLPSEHSPKNSYNHLNQTSPFLKRQTGLNTTGFQNAYLSEVNIDAFIPAQQNQEPQNLRSNTEVIQNFRKKLLINGGGLTSSPNTSQLRQAQKQPQQMIASEIIKIKDQSEINNPGQAVNLLISNEICVGSNAGVGRAQFSMPKQRMIQVLQNNLHQLQPHKIGFLNQAEIMPPLVQQVNDYIQKKSPNKMIPTSQPSPTHQKFSISLLSIKPEVLGQKITPLSTGLSQQQQHHQHDLSPGKIPAKPFLQRSSVQYPHQSHQYSNNASYYSGGGAGGIQSVNQQSNLAILSSQRISTAVKSLKGGRSSIMENVGNVMSGSNQSPNKKQM